jgi:pimeloyl-ACP methyl ester carboxylesterase
LADPVLTQISEGGSQSRVGDVIFIHGLNGNPMETWQVENKPKTFWPAWLANDLPEVNVWTLGYDVRSSGEGLALSDRAVNVLALLAGRNIGKSPIVFVAHSYGGLVVKQLLRSAIEFGDASWREIARQTKGVVFLSTPHSGSRIAKWARIVRGIFGPSPAVEDLQPNNPQLVELNQWYQRAALEYGIDAEVYVETRRTHNVTVVDRVSSDPGLPGVIPIPIEAAHGEICKPPTRQSIVYRGVKQFIRNKFAVSGLGRPAIGFESVSDIDTLAMVLQENFDFAWEPIGTVPRGSEIAVYWPVRLRTPTPIHAVQSFAAAALQRLGATVHLCIDDLGNCDASPDLFHRRVEKWITSVGGNFAAVRRHSFKDIITPAIAEKTWAKVEAWLGSTNYRLGKILRVSKLDDASDLQKLCERRPRRLLTPALVWTCFEHIQGQSGKHFVTLGGFDERDLWYAWRELMEVASSHAGHLYGPELREATANQNDESRVLHMAHTPLPLDWNAVRDIQDALLADLNTGGDWYSESRLLSWCLKGCVLLPAFLRGQQVDFTIDHQPIASVDDFRDLNVERVASEMSRQVTKWLL